MSMPPKDYWIKQAEARLLSAERNADKLTKELFGFYQQAASDIEKDINNLFAKYAKDNKLSYAEAQKLLSGKEYSVWRMGIEDYVKGSVGSKDPRILIELNTLAAKSRISRHEGLLADIYTHMIDLADIQNTKLTSHLSRIVTETYYKTGFDIQNGMKLGWNIARIDEKAVKAVLEFPWSGKRYSDRIWENTDRLAAVTRQELAIGFIRGDSNQQIARTIAEKMDASYGNAFRLAVTETNYAANQGELLSYKENGIELYEYVAELDGVTSMLCLSLNSAKFKIEDATPGINYPPMHPNCRSTTVAYFKQDFERNKSTESISRDLGYKEWQEKFIK